VVSLPLDRFLRFPELTEVLREMASAHPDLLHLSEAGRSHEGREIWLCTVTNRATGPHDEKPALWVDANIHATELTGSTAALHLVHRLVSEHGTDPVVTRAVDTRTFYVVPRMGPDGAELALAERPRKVRSSVRAWPRADQQDGLVPSDLDGDGRILSMRVPDPNGTWKPSGLDPRLLVPRQPTEEGGGPYYRLLAEGEIQGYDGATIPRAPALAGLDMNRNYPVDWRTAGDQLGAGPYPTSEPEIRAVVQAIVDRPNICAFLQYHTFSGLHLRPYGNKPDEEMPTFDLRTFKEIGAKATELTGYPAVSVYHDFRYDPKDVITGVADDWAYDHLGVHAWTTEFWNPLAAAGVQAADVIDWWRDHPLDDDLKLLAWADEELPGQGYVDWYPWEHPQLGPVELGGWDTTFFSNPPPALLEAEVRPHADWAIWHILISPEVRIRQAEATPAGEGTWRLRLVVENAGYLPTQVTQKALDRKAVRPVEAELELPEGCTLVSGDRRQELGQLAGRALVRSALRDFGTSNDGTPDRAKAEWVVRARPGTELRLVARHPRGGVARSTVVLADPVRTA